jgi:hypothetical protein
MPFPPENRLPASVDKGGDRYMTSADSGRRDAG